MKRQFNKGTLTTSEKKVKGKTRIEVDSELYNTEVIYQEVRQKKSIDREAEFKRQMAQGEMIANGISNMFKSIYK